MCGKRVTVGYTNGLRVVVSGHNLKAMADRLEAGRLGDIIQADPLELAGEKHCVTLTVRGDELAQLLQAVKAFRTSAVEGVEVVQDGGEPQHCLVTGLALEQEKG
jgi:hypothetical protein